ncbi:recombinase family protein [Methylocella sp. CPCC 101449]|uniref:recombinase family protein n=1 Tax=Methylocella sp. CPCC 101449 TaxID=2987531 RepID=UPI00289166DF|nr:recombinase family protein [Methylocella sp. CPCC 101449]MDT2021198.1 recombinase family protein [Methylocella sp. CPCC 101449]
MKPVVQKPQRCAIYTRKSTDHNLDLTFNSLDAQREACEAYIKSQAHEGWSLLPGRFDDGAFSGASLDRPALKTLIEIVKSRTIDIIVVYKVDRLTRSLADFAKLVELFDEYDVSFVSVTQSFNTTSSMGRLTLNVLLSFAQFEREVIGERVRDKISASKRKGLWVGGPIPVGYRSVNKKLEVVPQEADLVRRIFVDYLRLGSIPALVRSLNDEGLRPKPRQLSNGQVIAPTHYRNGPVNYLLRNRFYIGEVVYKGQVHVGEHEPILANDLFEAVQARLAAQAIERTRLQATSSWQLTGRIFDDRGHRMSPTHSTKNGVRYRFYVSQAAVQGLREKAGSLHRVSAPDVERTVAEALQAHLSADDGAINADPAALIQTHAQRVTVGRTSIHITVTPLHADAMPVILTAPFRPKQLPRKGVTHKAGSTETSDHNRQTLLHAIARAQRWIDDLRSGRSMSFAQIAQSENLVERHVRFLAPLAFLSPKIISSIADGSIHVTVSQLARGLPMVWADQEKRFNQ